MSIQGVPQLRKLLLRLSEHGGSSQGCRDFVRRTLPSFQAAYPHIDVEVQWRKNIAVHPVVRAEWLNGHSQMISLRKSGEEQVRQTVECLRCKTGRLIRSKWAVAQSTKQSLQGLWNPSFNYVPVDEQLKKRATTRDTLLGVVMPTPMGHRNA